MMADHMSAAWTYELLVKQVYDRLLGVERGVAVHHRRTYRGMRSGQNYEVDLSFEFTLAGVNFLVLVECKFYGRPVEISDAAEFAFKVHDIGAQKGILVSTVGFQRGVFNIARSGGIALMRVTSYTADILIANIGPKVDFNCAFAEHDEADTSGRPMPILGIVDGAGEPPTLCDYMELRSGGIIDLPVPWARFVVALCTDSRCEEGRSLLQEARQARDQRDFEEAVRLAEAALAIHERVYGEDHLAVAEVLNLLAGVYEKTGRYTQSESVARRAIETRTRQQGQKHRDVAISYSNLAPALLAQGRCEDAEQCLQTALTIIEGTDEAVLRAAIGCNLARVCGTTGRIQEAELLYSQSLQQMEEACGPDHLMVVNVLESYARFLREINRHSEAQHIQERIDEMRSDDLQ